MFGFGQRLALLAGFALLVVLRLPRAWTQGRFWAEEGSVFLAFAWHRPAGAALWRSFAGYLNLAANAFTLLDAKLVRAGIVPLEAAPYLTLSAALVFQSLPAVLLLTGRACWLTARWAVVASLLVLVAAPQTEEVFGNVLHIQFHLALCVALILALDVPAARRAQVGYGALLLLAPLCGPAAIVLLPLFALRSLVDRDLGRAAQTAVLAAGSLVQLLLFFTPSPVRGEMLGPVVLAAMLFVRLVALPLTTPGLANRLGAVIHAAYAGGGIGLWAAAAGALAWFATLLGLAGRERRDAAVWLVGSGLAIAAVSFGGGMIAADPRQWFSVGFGERYNFLPLVLLGLGLIALASRPAWRGRRACLGLVVLVLLAGAVQYPRPLEELSQGPSWRGEVAAWRRDHAHPLLLWPGGLGLFADLSDHDRPCPPPGATGEAGAGYCEGAWEALQRRPPTPRDSR